MADLDPLAISVVIPVYNAAKFVEAAVASALQFTEVEEVVLVDDGGPDNSLSVCQDLTRREPRVKLYRHPGGANLGAAESRNLGMRMSRAPYIAFLDADDFYLPGRFDAEREVFRLHPDADGVYGAIGAHFQDQQGKERFEKVFSRQLTTVRQRVQPEKLFHGLVGLLGDFGYFSLDALTVKRQALQRMDDLMRSGLRLHQDTDFLVRMAWYLRLYPGTLEEPVAMRRVHDDNRFLKQRSFHSNTLLYGSLWRWSVRVGVDGQAREVFHRKYRMYAVGGASSKVKALGIAMRYRRFLPNYDFRDALFIRITGNGTFATRLLHKVGWRIWHRGKA